MFTVLILMNFFSLVTSFWYRFPVRFFEQKKKKRWSSKFSIKYISRFSYFPVRKKCPNTRPGIVQY